MRAKNNKREKSKSRKKLFSKTYKPKLNNSKADEHYGLAKPLPTESDEILVEIEQNKIEFLNSIK